MIVSFPNLNLLKVALSSGAVPPDVAQKPAAAGFGPEGQVWIETTAKLPAAAQRELKRLGAFVGKASGAARDADVSCWLELLPLVRDDVPLDALEQVPVLFDAPSGAALSRLVLEMLRLGNDRQSYRWLEEAEGRAGPRRRSESVRALLRVVGPPYYSLLRALDQLGGPEVAPHAFLERAPGVWVEIGYRHPLAAHIKPPQGHILLLRPPRQWLLLADAPFRDIYEIVEFRLPNRATRWKDSPLPHRLAVALRLRQAGPADGAELWVLRGDALAELNRFVQDAQEQLLGRLAFAVGAKNGQTIVVLRARPSKLPPPILVLPAEAYKSYLRLSNLFLPVGHVLHPPLRRDVVRKLLAESPGQITWLAPGENGCFTPEGLPDDVFRPLTDWVDYVLDRDREPLQAWVQAMRFEFESFICDDDQPNKPKKPPAFEKVRGPDEGPVRPPAEHESGAARTSTTPAETGTEGPLLAAFAAVAARELSAIEKELHAVEETFLSLPGGLDDAARRVLWPRLAELNACLLQWEDAGICWLHALWNAAAADASKWAAAWLRTEVQSAIRNPQSVFRRGTDEGEQMGQALDRLLSLAEPATADLRVLAAYLTWSAQRDPRPPELMQRLPTIQHFLAKYETALPVRAYWLAWRHLADLTGGDVLALARARDRLLERLFHNGLRPEQDLPGFLRSSGRPDHQHCREVREWLTKLCDKVHSWIEDNHDPLDRKTLTPAYADLLFAFGLARLGESDGAKRLLQRARNTLNGANRVHGFLLAAFEGRIQNVLDGKPHTGPLPQSLLDELNGMTQLDRYVIERVRHNSRVLEPDRQIDPYRHWAARQSDWDKALVEVLDWSDRQEIPTRLRALMRQISPGPMAAQDRLKVLRVGLELGPYIGEEFTREMLQQTLPLVDAWFTSADPAVLEERAQFLAKALFAAAHFGCTEQVRSLVRCFRDLLRAQQGGQNLEALGALAEQSFRSLRKLGLREDIERLLGEMAAIILQGKDIPTLMRSWGSGNEVLASLIALLHVAGAWYYFGRDHLAEPVVQAARILLFGNELTQAKQRRDLACAYARTLGQATPAVALARLEEMFTHLHNYRDTFTTSGHFSVVQMDLIESVVLAVVHDDFTQSAQARRWLEEEEYLVRQRIHSEVHHLMAQG